MRAARLRLLTGAAGADIALLRLLAIRSAVHAALLAATLVFPIRHISAPSSAKIHRRTQEERFGARAVSQKGRFASLKRSAVAQGAWKRDLLSGHVARNRPRSHG